MNEFLVYAFWPFQFPFMTNAMAIAVGTLSSLIGAYLSFFLDGATGGVIVVLQTLVFLLAFFFAPKHGMLASRRRAAREIAS